jgi:hypothetical protein
VVLLLNQRRQRYLQKEKRNYPSGFRSTDFMCIPASRRARKNVLIGAGSCSLPIKKNCTRNSLKVFTGTERKIEIKKMQKQILKNYELQKKLMRGQSREIPGEGHGLQIRRQPSKRKHFSLTGCKSFKKHKITDLDERKKIPRNPQFFNQAQSTYLDPLCSHPPANGSAVQCAVSGAVRAMSSSPPVWLIFGRLQHFVDFSHTL